MSRRNREHWKVESQSTASPRRRGRRWLWGSLGTLGILAAVLWFAPAIVAHTSLRQSIVSAALADFEGQVTVGAASLGWLSPLAAYDVTAVDTAGQPLAAAKSVRSEKSLLSTAVGTSRPGGFQVEQPELQLVLRENGSNLEDALAVYLRGPSSGSAVQSVKLDIVGGALKVQDAASGQTWQVSDLNASAELADGVEWPVLVRLAGQVHASPLRRGTVTAEIAWRATPEAAAGMGDGQVKARLEGLPLETLSSAARRWIGDLQARGDATGEGLYQWADNGTRQQLRIDRLTCTDAALRASVAGAGRAAIQVAGVPGADPNRRRPLAGPRVLAGIRLGQAPGPGHAGQRPAGCLRPRGRRCWTSCCSPARR